MRPHAPAYTADVAKKEAKPLRDASRGTRLQRVLAEAGVASRRTCERLIEEGHVRVNDRVVTTLPAWVDPDEDRIEVDGRRVGTRQRLVYVMLNKPKHTISTSKDEPGSDRRTVTQLVSHPSGVRLFSVGRLDYDTTGLVLLTNDGKLAGLLTHPRYGIAKTYRATVRGRLDDDAIDRIERGVFLAERRPGKAVGAARTGEVEVEVIRRDRDRTLLAITLREGRNREVRRLLAGVGYPVKRLERVQMGPLRLKGLARGEWRELERSELQAIRRAASKASKQAQGGSAKPEPENTGTRSRSRRGRAGGAAKKGRSRR